MSQQSASDDEWSLAHHEGAITIPKPSDYTRNDDEERLGHQAAILRSLRAAGVKFVRYAVVDAFNQIRCKTVPVKRALASLPSRTHSGSGTSPAVCPMSNPVSIAEICFAGLPTHADAPVPGTNLRGRNVLTLRPDFSSLRVLPYAPSTALVLCTAHDQRTGELSPLCTRLLERVLRAARDDLGVEFCVGAELEFQLYHPEAQDGSPRPVDASVFGNAATLDERDEFISTLYDQLDGQDIPVELIHSESAPGQLELVLSYSINVVQLADDVVLARESIAACAKKHGLKALFLPKTSMITAGNGLHLHFSFRDVGSSDNAFSDPASPTGMSPRGGAFVEGILDRLPSLLGVTLPTNNSFRRVGPGCWTRSSVGWSTEDKESPLRVCVDLDTRRTTNVELKLSDGTANIYLELAAVLAAGMDGMKHGRKLRPAIEDDATEPLPASLIESLELLKKDDFLLSVLGQQLSTGYLAVRQFEAKMEKTLEEEVMDAFRRA